MSRPTPKSLSLDEVIDGTKRASQRVAKWPEWKRSLERPPTEVSEISMSNKLTWNEARRNGILWFINSRLHDVGLSLFLEGHYDPDTDEMDESRGVRAYIGRNACRGFAPEDEAKLRKAFGRWLAENAARNFADAYPDDEG
jgi:hypothetical protein